jgi:hypothetical protein
VERLGTQHILHGLIVLAFVGPQVESQVPLLQAFREILLRPPVLMSRFVT